MWVKWAGSAKDEVVVRYEPPSGYSPAALGFLRSGGSQTQFAAAL